MPLTDIVFLVVLSLGAGFALGWIARSIQFAKDKDCANPEHKP